MDQTPATPPNNTPPVPVTPPPASAPEPTPAVLPSLPDSWPGAFGIYKYSKQAVKLNIGTLISIWLFTVVISLGADLALKGFGQIIADLLSGLYAGSLVLVLLASLRGQPMSFGQALKEALPFWLKMIGLSILIVLSAIVSTLLLIIPLFFVLPRLTLAQYFLIDQKMGVVEAYKASWAATKGNVGKVWGIIGASILMGLLMVTIVGIPFSIYFLVMYSAAFAVLYKYLEASRPAATTAPAAVSLPPSPIQNDTPTAPVQPVVVAPTAPPASPNDTPPTA